MFEEYKVIYIIHTTLAAVLLLVLLKILAFGLNLLSCCKGCCQLCKDFQEFRLGRRGRDRVGKGPPV